MNSSGCSRSKQAVSLHDLMHTQLARITPSAGKTETQSAFLNCEPHNTLRFLLLSKKSRYYDFEQNILVALNILICILFLGTGDFHWKAIVMFFLLCSLDLETTFSILRNHSEIKTPHMFRNP